MVLTVNGKAATVVQDAAYQRLLDIAAQASAVEGIRQGRDDVKSGRMHDARKALTAIKRASDEFNSHPNGINSRPER